MIRPVRATASGNAARPLESTARAPSLDLLFAGLCFHVEAPSRVLALFEAVPHALIDGAPLSGRALAPLARVECRIEILGMAAAGGRPKGGAPIACVWNAQRGEVQTRGVRAELERVGPRLFSAEVRMGADRMAASAFFVAASAAILHALGGAVLHAASIELGERAIAFVGPSGAGKSTACLHSAGGRLFSIDRLAVAPSSNGWVACPLPGGTAPATALASSRAMLPLGAVLRVRQSTEGARIEVCSPTRRLALLRQAAFQGGRTPADEAALLASLDALGHALPVGSVQFGLGDPLSPLIERFTREGC